MPLSISLRRRMETSPFREELLRLCRCPTGDVLFLGSGYFWEPIETKSARAQYSVLADDLLEAIVQGGCRNGRVVTIGGKFERSVWKERYRCFVRRLRGSGVEVDPYQAPQRNWHAKVAIRLESPGRSQEPAIPIAAIVGSSNLTGPAYRAPYGRWNYECDVAIWMDRPDLNNYFLPPHDGLDPIDRMVTILHPEAKQPSESEQLRQLLDDAHEGLIRFEE